jgi:hypothetical protein
VLLATGCFSPDDTEESGSTGTDGTSTSAGPGDTGNPETSSTDPTPGTSMVTTDADTSGGMSMGQVRAIHAAAGVGAVDLYLAGEGAPVVEGLDYAEASPWIDVSMPSVTFEVRVAGESAESEPLYVSDPIAVDGARVNAVAGGTLDAESDDAAFRLLAIAEDWGASLAGRARARVVHAGPDAPTLTVGEVTVPRFESSDAEGFALELAGDRLQVDDDAANGLTSFTTPAVADGDEVLFIAAGELQRLAREDAGFVLLMVGREGVLGVVRQDPELFLVHGSRELVPVVFCAGEDNLAANVAYGELESGRVSPGTYDMSLYSYPGGCVGRQDLLSTNTTGELEAGGRYLVLATGEPNPEPQEAGVQAATFTDAFSLGETDALVRFVHGASYTEIFVGSVIDGQIPAINVYTDAIEWRDESDEVPLMPSQYILGVANAGMGAMPPLTPLYTVQFDALPGARQWVIAAGDATPDSKEEGGLQALVVDTTPPQWSTAVVDFVQVP